MFLNSLCNGIRTALYACALALPVGAIADQTVTLAGHLPPILNSAHRLHRVANAEKVSLALVLPLHNQDQLNELLQRLYTPGDVMYGQYLTPDAFAEQFSPTQAEYNAVLAFAQSQGLTISTTHPNRTVVEVTGDAQTVERAFGVQLNQYQAQDGGVFRAPSQEPQIPALLAGHLAAVIGLDTAAAWKTHAIKKQAAPGGVEAFSLNPHGGGSGPGGGLTPSDIKTAYTMNGISADGTGQTLGLMELTGYNPSDVVAYEKAYNLPNVPLQNILLNGFNGAPGSGADEVTLDIELQIAIAPGASKIYIYEAPNSNAGVVAIYNKMATDNLAKSISTSWGIAELSIGNSTRNSENQAFQQMAAQGQSNFAASGDAGAYDNRSTLSVDDPASQPYVTGVGGTSLVTNGAGGPWSAEATWNGGSIAAGAGGGGVSAVWSKPAYQGNYGVSSTFRNVPDVSFDADPASGYSIFYAGTWTIYGGTSCAAPVWSGFAACVNQARVAAGKSTLGFANTLIYQLGASANYALDFHDIADSSTNLYYQTATGYDNATGWGTINGVGLFADMVNGGPVTSGSAPAKTVYQIASGSNGVTPFVADSYYHGGESGAFSQPVNTTGVAEAAPMAVYKCLRFGNFTYNVPNLTVGATYTVRLHFSEDYFANAGKRVFNVAINGATVLSNFDIAAAVGPNKALVKDFPTAADSKGMINLNFVSIVDNAQVNGIEVLSGTATGSSNTGVTGPSAPNPPTGLTTTPGNAQVTLSWSAVSGATSYRVYRSTTSGIGYKLVGSPTAISAVDTGLVDGVTYYYAVTTVNAAGESDLSADVLAIPAAPGKVYQLNCGSGVSGAFTTGTFGPDNFYTAGDTGSFGQSVSFFGVINSAPMSVYQSVRFGNFAYNLPYLTPGTTYTVRLHFAELYFSQAGQRVFNVAINGTNVLTNFDIAAAVGPNKALVKDFSATADSNGKINITFTSVVDNAMINGIELLR